MKSGWWALCVLALACSSPPDGPDTAGTGSKAGNAFKIKGVVVYSKGSGNSLDQENVLITVYKVVPQTASGYDWYPIKTGFPDTSGAFKFDSLQAGEYSLVLKNKDSTYMAFSGYIYLGEQDTILDLDTMVLAPTLSVMGMFQYTSVNDIQVSLVGTSSQVTIQCDTAIFEQQRYFVFGNIPIGNYKIKVALYNGQPQEKDFYIPLPTEVVLAADSTFDTSYTDTSYGQVNNIRITEKMFELINSYFKIVCFVVKNEVSQPLSAKTAVQQPSVIDLIKEQAYTSKIILTK